MSPSRSAGWLRLAWMGLIALSLTRLVNAQGLPYFVNSTGDAGHVLRTIDRMRLSGTIVDRQAGELIGRAQAVFDAVEFVPLNAAILNRAAQSFLTALGTQDAPDLSTALWLVGSVATELTFLTHDAELALAAGSVNFSVDGA